jgi:hypothetical protein
MTESMCPSLRRLALFLLTAYRLRDDRLVSRKDNEVLAKAERDLLRVHQLITRHRNSCRICRFNEALHGLPRRYNDSRTDVVSINQVH